MVLPMSTYISRGNDHSTGDPINDGVYYANNPQLSTITLGGILSNEGGKLIKNNWEVGGIVNLFERIDGLPRVFNAIRLKPEGESKIIENLQQLLDNDDNDPDNMIKKWSPISNMINFISSITMPLYKSSLTWYKEGDGQRSLSIIQKLMPELELSNFAAEFPKIERAFFLRVDDDETPLEVGYNSTNVDLWPKIIRYRWPNYKQIYFLSFMKTCQKILNFYKKLIPPTPPLPPEEAVTVAVGSLNEIEATKIRDMVNSMLHHPDFESEGGWNNPNEPELVEFMKEITADLNYQRYFEALNGMYYGMYLPAAIRTPNPGLAALEEKEEIITAAIKLFNINKLLTINIYNDKISELFDFFFPSSHSDLSEEDIAKLNDLKRKIFAFKHLYDGKPVPPETWQGGGAGDTNDTDKKTNEVIKKDNNIIMKGGSGLMDEYIIWTQLLENPAIVCWVEGGADKNWCPPVPFFPAWKDVGTSRRPNICFEIPPACVDVWEQNFLENLNSLWQQNEKQKYMSYLLNPENKFLSEEQDPSKKQNEDDWGMWMKVLKPTTINPNNFLRSSDDGDVNIEKINNFIKKMQELLNALSETPNILDDLSYVTTLEPIIKDFGSLILLQKQSKFLLPPKHDSVRKIWSIQVGFAKQLNFLLYFFNGQTADSGTNQVKQFLAAYGEPPPPGGTIDISSLALLLLDFINRFEKSFNMIIQLAKFEQVKALVGRQKINFAYTLGIITRYYLTSTENIYNNLLNNLLIADQDAYTNEIQLLQEQREIIESVIPSDDIPKEGGFTGDERLINKFLKILSEGKESNKFMGQEGNPPSFWLNFRGNDALSEGIVKSLGEGNLDAYGGRALYEKMNSTYKTHPKFYISNAVANSWTSNPPNCGKPGEKDCSLTDNFLRYFCPLSSMIDAQPQCPYKNTSENGWEWGDMDVKIFSPADGIIPGMSYQVTLVCEGGGPNQTSKESSYLGGGFD